MVKAVSSHGRKSLPAVVIPPTAMLYVLITVTSSSSELRLMQICTGNQGEFIRENINQKCVNVKIIDIKTH